MQWIFKELCCICHKNGGIVAVPLNHPGFVLPPGSGRQVVHGCSCSSIYFNDPVILAAITVAPAALDLALPIPVFLLCECTRVHACVCASVHECVCVPVLLYFTGLCDCAPDIQSHTDGIHLTWKPGWTSSTSRHLLCLMHHLTLLQGCFFLPPWPWHLPSRPLIILSPRLRFYLSKTFDPVVSLRIEFDMWRRCLASLCCRVIFFLSPP